MTRAHALAAWVMLLGPAAVNASLLPADIEWPPFLGARAEEDYRSFRPQARSLPPAARIKAIEVADGAWLSLGGELRAWGERIDDEGFGRVAMGRDRFLLSRAMLHATLDGDGPWRAHLGVLGAWEDGRDRGPRRTDEDRGDLHQAFIEWRDAPWTLRAGRQEFNLGSARLVTLRDNPNVRLSFDALRAIREAGAWRVDLFAGREVEVRTGAWDDRGRVQRRLWGAYATRPPATGHAGIDIYLLGIDRRQAAFAAGRADERRESLGLRLFGRDETWDWNVEAVLQGGRFGTRRIRAWTLASETGWRPAWPGGARVSVKANVTSGDRDPSDDVLGTFNALYPRGSYFGRLSSVGPYNHIDLQPELSLQLSATTELSIGHIWFWRQSTTDGVYSVPGNLLLTPGGSRARAIGRQPQVEFNWTPNRHLAFGIALARFERGAFLREVDARGMHYAAAWATLRF